VSIIFEEQASGTDRDGRTELQKVLSVLGSGDGLVVTRLDRLGRSLRDLANIADEIEQAGAHSKSLSKGGLIERSGPRVLRNACRLRRL
jgi:DNA invertase Pin-like site-specific DNA recombinase